MFGSVLGYVMLRILGEGPDDGEDMTMGSGRRWILDHGGATGIPSWGKFWLTVLGVHEWEGCNPMPPEFWLLPKISPIHPGKLLCYCRLVYMPMSYLYGKRFVGPITGLVQSLRNELYIEPYDRTNWNRARNTCAKEDLYYPHPLVEDALWGFLHYVGEPVLTCWPFSVLRKKALNVAMKHIHYEDESNRYLCIGCVEKVLCLIACWVEDPNSDAYKLHLERIPDYFWLAEDGMKIQSFGSQSWDAALSIQAITSSNLSHEYGPTLHKAHDFIKASQAVLLLSQMSPELVGEKIEKHCQCDAVNLILSLQSTNRGFPAWEPQRAFCWLEYFNPVEFLEDVLIEREYVECTASAIQALLQFKKLNPEHRRKEIESSIARGIKYIEDTQNDDGSWYGFCGICFTYGTWFAVKGLTACRKPYYNFPELRKACAFLLSKQLPDGGWGESHFSSSKKVYTNLEEGKRSNLVQTSWALLSLTAAGQTEIDPEPVHRGMRLLINSQMEDGVSLSR